MKRIILLLIPLTVAQTSFGQSQEVTKQQSDAKDLGGGLTSNGSEVSLQNLLEAESADKSRSENITPILDTNQLMGDPSLQNSERQQTIDEFLNSYRTEQNSSNIRINEVEKVTTPRDTENGGLEMPKGSPEDSVRDYIEKYNSQKQNLVPTNQSLPPNTKKLKEQ